jgi:peptidoglycan/LPS O-acetylase OafA/YrhL
MKGKLQIEPFERPIGRLTRLDGLRGVLAAYVMLGHAAPFIPWPPLIGQVVEAVVGHGFAAVNLFFALSGLVIVQTVARFKGRALPFLAARARRLLPVYFVVLAFAIVALAWRSPFAGMPWVHPGSLEFQFWEQGLPRPIFADIVLHLTLLHGMMPHGWYPNAQFSLLGPAWSLSTEWQFYGAIALVIPLIGSDDRGLARLVWACLALAVAGRIYAMLVPLPWQFHRAFLSNEAAYFAIGIAAARLWRGADWFGAFAVPLVVAVLIGASHGSGLGMIGKALPPLLWAVAVAAQRHPENRLVHPLVGMLDHPVVLWLGAVSYPLYLVNEPVGRVLAVLVGAESHGDEFWFSVLWAPLTLATSIGAAALLHYTVERRFTRRLVRPPVGTPTMVMAAAPLRDRAGV